MTSHLRHGLCHFNVTLTGICIMNTRFSHLNNRCRYLQKSKDVILCYTKDSLSIRHQMRYQKYRFSYRPKGVTFQYTLIEGNLNKFSVTNTTGEQYSKTTQALLSVYTYMYTHTLSGFTNIPYLSSLSLSFSRKTVNSTDIQFPFKFAKGSP